MFCVRGFGGGVGVSLFFWGVVLAFRRVFSGFWGFLCFLLVLLRVLGWVAGCGGFRGSGFGAPGRLASFLLGGGSGVRLRAPGCSPGCLVLAVVGVGGRVRGVRVARLPAVWWGSGCARFLLLLVVVGVFGCCFFRPVLLVSSGSAVLGPLLGCGFRGVGGLWGVSGWVRGCFFSGFCCTGPGLFPVSFCGGLVWVWVGFCLESLILAQDERWRRA